MKARKVQKHGAFQCICFLQARTYRETVEFPKRRSPTGRGEGSCTVYLPVATQRWGASRFVFPSRDVDQIFSTNNRLSAEWIDYSYIMSSIGCYSCTTTRSSNRALLGSPSIHISTTCSSCSFWSIFSGVSVLAFLRPEDHEKLSVDINVLLAQARRWTVSAH